MTAVLKTFYNAFEDATVPSQLSELDEEFMLRYFPRMPAARSEANLSLLGAYKSLERMNIPRNESCDSMTSVGSNISSMDSFANLDALDLNDTAAQENAIVHILKAFYLVFEDFMKNVPPGNPYDENAEAPAFPRVC